MFIRNPSLASGCKVPQSKMFAKSAYHTRIKPAGSDHSPLTAVPSAGTHLINKMFSSISSPFENAPSLDENQALNAECSDEVCNSLPT